MDNETPNIHNDHDQYACQINQPKTDTLKHLTPTWCMIFGHIANSAIAICTIILAFIAYGTLKQAEDTSKRQLRAYVTPIVQSTEIDIATVSVKMVIDNYGVTPAKNSKIATYMEILPLPLPKKFIFNVSTNESRQTSRIYPRTPTTEIENKKTFTMAEINEVLSKSSKRSIYAYGVMTYDDIFNETHSTRFCFYINPRSIKTVSTKKTTATINFNWAECDQHNDFN